MNKKLNEVKDKIYEAEGLLELLQLRPDKMDSLAPLILARIDEARTGFSEISAKREAPAETISSEPMTEAFAESDNTSIYQVPEEEEEESEPAKIANIANIANIATEPVKEPAKEAAMPAFCLNDRFRFRRSLFGGSDAAFNQAMNKLATFDSYEEAEEYFYAEPGFDPENEDTQEFMAKIKEYFER